MSLFAVLLTLAGGVGDAAPLPKTGIRYNIAVRINPTSRRFAGIERIRWTNPSSTAVSRLPLHLYLNAFSHLGTTWLREATESHKWFDMSDFLAKHPDPWGWIEPLSIEQLITARGRKGHGPAARGAAATHKARWRPVQPDDGNRLDRTLIEIELPKTVAAGETLDLRIRFSGRLPEPMARTGCTPNFCLVAQWFPKVAVLEPTGVRHADKPRWAARQFHAATEFYADFADYEVAIEAPRGWTVGATGQRTGPPSPVRGGYQRLRYTQRAVHDFAIVLGRGLHDVSHRHTPKAKQATPIDVRYLVPKALAHQVKPARRAIERALNLFARRVGPYPYRTLTVVMPPFRASHTAGMEYPTLITNLPADPLWDRFPIRQFQAEDAVLVHEFSHQYFYGLLATNEQEEAFLDEGFTSYFEGRCMQALYGKRANGWLLGRPVGTTALYSVGLDNRRRRIREPLRRRPSALFYPGTHGLQNYNRGALALWTATHRFGRRKVDAVFASYYRRFRFRHPDVDDFLQVVREAGSKPMADFLSEAFSRERVPDFKVVSLSSQPFKAPLGRVTDDKGSFTVTAQNRSSLRQRLETRRMRDAGNQVWVEITDPGWSRGGSSVYGRTHWVPFRRGKTTGSSGKRLYQSKALITGPAWDHLPATVLLRFDDGVEIRERWDGKAAWRAYRTIRPARLTEVRIDELRLLEVDVTPQNNSRRRQADRRFLADWGGWLGAFVQWMAGGLSLWL